MNDMAIRITVWSRAYGEIYSVRCQHQYPAKATNHDPKLKSGPGTAIVLSSPEAMKQILELQSADTSDRPPNSLHDVSTWSSLENRLLTMHIAIPASDRQMELLSVSLL